MIPKKDFLFSFEGIDISGRTTQADSFNEYFEKRGPKTVLSIDPSDRRLGIKRRQFIYSLHIPERRSGTDRRSGVDRRVAPFNYREDKERRQTFH